MVDFFAINMNLGDMEAISGLRSAQKISKMLGVELLTVDLADGMRKAYNKPFPQHMRMVQDISIRPSKIPKKF